MRIVNLLFLFLVGTSRATKVNWDHPIFNSATWRFWERKKPGSLAPITRVEDSPSMLAPARNAAVANINHGPEA